MILAALAAIGPVPMACCTYVERVLGRAYGPTVVAVGLTSNWNLWYPDKDPWSPVTAAALAGIGQVTATPAPGAWHVVQGWRTEPSTLGSGHTFLLFVGIDGRCLLAESVLQRPAAVRHVTIADLEREFTHGLRYARLRRTPSNDT